MVELIVLWFSLLSNAGLVVKNADSYSLSLITVGSSLAWVTCGMASSALDGQMVFLKALWIYKFPPQVF